MTSFDGFEDDARASSNAYYRRGCAVAHLLADLAPEDADKVRAVLDRREITSTAIREALAKRVENYPSVFTLNRHRRGQCSCALGVETK